MRLEQVAVGGLRLGARIAGDASRPALVLLHGWPHAAQLWDAVLDPLGEDFFALAFDLPEIGESRGAPPSSEKYVLAGLLLEAAAALGAARPVVCGLDIGGMIAFAAARDHGAKIAGAVVMNTVLPGLEPWEEVLADPRIFHFAFHNVPDLPETLVAERERAYFDFFTDMRAGDPDAIGDKLRGDFARAYSRPEALKAGFDWYRALSDDASRNAAPADIATPLLYLRGDAGGTDMAAYERSLRAAGVRDLTLDRIAGSGEFIPVEAPQACVSAIADFAHRCRLR